MTTVIPRLPAPKQRREVSVKILKGPVYLLKSWRIHHPYPPPEVFTISLIIPSCQPSL